jgi:nitrogen-specific signal transduction histidine kinase
MNQPPGFISVWFITALKTASIRRGDINMSANEMVEKPLVDEVTMLVCDAGGRIQAVTSSASVDLIPCSPTKHEHFAELFGDGSEVTEWLTHHMNEARKQGDYYHQSHLENGSNPLIIRLESLKCDEEIFGFALTLEPESARAARDPLQEGDAIVHRKQWHEIKNHIGALKLYATFLTKKMADGDERQTVEKMLNGINGLIDYLAKIRRGEAQ